MRFARFSCKEIVAPGTRDRKPTASGKNNLGISVAMVQTLCGYYFYLITSRYLTAYILISWKVWNSQSYLVLAKVHLISYQDQQAWPYDLYTIVVETPVNRSFHSYMKRNSKKCIGMTLGIVT